MVAGAHDDGDGEKSSMAPARLLLPPLTHPSSSRLWSPSASDTVSTHALQVPRASTTMRSERPSFVLLSARLTSLPLARLPLSYPISATSCHEGLQVLGCNVLNYDMIVPRRSLKVVY
ncbi:hypothetical protein EIP91_008105 [Steccherinum ochraceum]|uniref:Uncharacterized protein n=1 Tax=Steccherinum ochraceum TaxID=92696 RepID=A0A4R0R625_9APHY|nr:hypothetical protein EIP91_008105 [Steccherinum ochraceum]